MNISTFVALMNEDLKNEYTHHRFYLQASFLLQGFDRLHFGPWLKAQAAEELGHVETFAKKIVANGGTPTTDAHFFPNHTNAIDILNHAINLEIEVVKNYTIRLQQAEELYEATGGYYDLVLLYEEQIEHSQADIDEMRMIMWGLTPTGGLMSV